MLLNGEKKETLKLLIVRGGWGMLFKWWKKQGQTICTFWVGVCGWSPLG